MSRSNLLIDETPLVFQPTLAKAIGLSEAIVLQTLHYHCSNKRCGRLVDDKRWIYNSYKGWREEFFPFWSERTIADIFRALETMGLVRSCQLDLKQGKAMKYYTVSNVAKTLLTSERFAHMEDSSTWGGMLQDLPDAMLQDLPDHQAKNVRSARASNISIITKNLTNSIEQSETTIPVEKEIHPTENPQDGKTAISEFDSFYATYPKKVAKHNAKKAWMKNKCSLEQVLPALEAHKKNWKDPQFIPHPATWLNQRRWEDDITVNNTQANPPRMLPADLIKHNNWTDEFWTWLHVDQDRADIERDYLGSIEERWLIDFIKHKNEQGYF
jgi:hypothetical protein